MSQAGFFFYTGDWLKDTRTLSLEARGAWIDLLCALHEAGGSVTWPLRAFDQYWGTIEHNGIEYSAREILDELAMLNICTVVTEPNGGITVTSRRLKREANSRESGKKRQKRFREKTDSNASVTALGNGSSSSESSSSSDSSKKKNPVPATPGSQKKEVRNPEESSYRLSQELIDEAKALGGTSQQAQQKLVQWVLSMTQSQRGEPMERVYAVTRASIAALRKQLEAGKEIKDLWGYLTEIFKRERTKFIQEVEHPRNKAPVPTEIIGAIFDRIGKGRA